jgi:5-methyltetrahydropteroyltriglutamate--homocysteine methyltransferase
VALWSCQRITGPIRRLRPVEVRNVEFLRANTDRVIKITLLGPFTMSRQAKNEFYKHEEELVMDYAAAVNEEVRDLKAAGADVIQLDEPWLQARAEEARRLALPAIDRALDGIAGPTALHLCFG